MADKLAGTVEQNNQFNLETGVQDPGSYTLVERKGFGHPDTLADHLAEELSRAYSRWTWEECGAILHHNFDKLALLGGATRVWYGGGTIVEPVRVLVNGRATRKCGSTIVPVDELVVDTVRSFIKARLPELSGDFKVELNITSNSSPGAVHNSAAQPERMSWFAPTSVDQLRERRELLANDTSLGTGWAPQGSVEGFVCDLVDWFAAPGKFSMLRPWCGSDVKMMALADKEHLDAVLCIPQKSAYVPDRATYINNCAELLHECHRKARDELPDREAIFRVNARDIVTNDEIYLTYSGSSIESGDEGLVGRGNRVNGLITPLRPMNLEGVNGKNPVYHVGKLYNVAAQRIAQELHVIFGGYVEVHLVSATGQPLATPWRSLVRMSQTGVAKSEVRLVVEKVLSSISTLTLEIIYGRQFLA